MRKLCAFASGGAAAVFLAAYLLPWEARLPAAALCALAGTGLLLLQRRGRKDKLLWLLLTAYGLALGLGWSWGYDLAAARPAQALDGRTAEVTATVADYPEDRGYGAWVEVRLQAGDGRTWKAVLYTREDGTGWKPGDRISCTAELRMADGAGRAGGVFLRAYAQGPLTVEAAPGVPPRFWPKTVARAVRESVTALFPPDTAGFLTALLTGEKGGMEGSLYTALRRTGIAHVVAVSGLHVSFFAGLLGALFRRRRRLGAGITIGLLLFFAAAAGNTPSVLRAVYMNAALLLAPLLGRENDPPTSLCAVLLLLLLANPYAARSVGLQLSFASVAGIQLFTGRLQRRWTRGLKSRGKPWPVRLGHGVWRFAAASLAVSLGALALTTPLLAVYFRQISLVAPLANLLTLWAVSDVFMGGLITALLGMVFPGVGTALAGVLAVLVRYVQGTARWLARFPFAAASTRSPYMLGWLVFAYVLFLLWAAWRGEKKRLLLPGCACLLTLAAALALQAFSLGGGGLSVSVLDVGQGQSVLFTSAGASVLVDCGGTGRDNPGDVAADYVQAMGRTRLDLLVLTHYHEDHAGGVAELMERLDVTAAALPDVEPDSPLRTEVLALAAEKGTEVFFVTEDTALTFGGAGLTLFAPLGTGGGNEEGLSVLCTQKGFDVLVTGDMNAAVERRLLKYGNLPDVELLVAGHHGGAGSTSAELLEAVGPETAVISVGYNTYGHPAWATLERLAAAGCDIYRTDWQGTVTVRGGQ